MASQSSTTNQTRLVQVLSIYSSRVDTRILLALRDSGFAATIFAPQSGEA
jgi:hypothetical protein